MIKTIGRYQVEGEIGRGGFGVVYRALDPVMNRRVAIKTLTSTQDPETIQRFRNEASAAGKLRHRNIITIFDSGEQGSMPYIVMELLEGEDLQRVIASRRPMSLLEKMRILSQIADGLGHAHQNGVVHRDVKPANMMVLGDGTVKVLDFGIALVSQLATRLTRTGMLPGTLRYMAPEQFLGASSDELSDIFAYGIVCYELLTGRHPFDAKAEAATMYNIIHVQPAPVRKVFAECPRQLDEVVMRLLSKDRKDRYPNLEDAMLDAQPVVVKLQQQHARTLMTEAERLAAGDSVDAAHGVIRQVLELDPENRGARQLRDKLVRIERESTRRRAEEALRRGTELAASGDLAEAERSFDSALRADSSSGIKALVEEARARMQRAAEARERVEQARAAFERGDLSGARKAAIAAGRAEPDNREAGALLARIDEHEARIERERKLALALETGRAAVAAGRFDQAAQVLSEFEQSSAEAANLLAFARAGQETERRSRRLKAELEAAAHLLNAGAHADACRLLGELSRDFPDSAEVARLAAEAEQRRLAAEQARLREAELAREAERKLRAQIEAAAHGIRLLIAAGRLDEAEASLGRASATFPGEEALAAVRQEAAAARAAVQQKLARREKLVADVRSLFASGRLEPAMNAAQAALAEFPGDAALTSLAGEIRAAIDREQEDRRLRETGRKQARDAARSARDAGRLAEALAEVGKATAEFGADAGLEELERDIRARMARISRRDQTADEAEQLRATSRFAKALKVIDSGLREIPDDPVLASLRSEILRDADLERTRRQLARQARLPRAIDRRLLAPAAVALGIVLVAVALWFFLGRRHETRATPAQAPSPQAMVEPPVAQPRVSPPDRQAAEETPAPVPAEPRLALESPAAPPRERSSPPAQNAKPFQPPPSETKTEPAPSLPPPSNPRVEPQLVPPSPVVQTAAVPPPPAPPPSQDRRDNVAEAAARAAAQASLKKRQDDVEAVLATLRRYSGAFGSRDAGVLQAVWPSMPRRSLDTYQQLFRDSRTSISMELRPVAPPEVSADTATVVCQRTSSTTAGGQVRQTPAAQVRVTLGRVNNTWVIQRIE